jgi:uncharacterized protein YecT (DUF1311 family)
MRLVWVVAVALATAGCAGSSSGSATPLSSSSSSSTPTGPPTVTEVFTPLPCNPDTTVGMEGCAEHRILRADKLVNRRTQLIWGASTAEGKAHLAAAQSAWQDYREAACLSESDKYAGGTLAPVVVAQCSLRITLARAADLRRQLRLLTSD